MSVFTTLLAPILLLLYSYDPEYFLKSKDALSSDYDQVPEEGFATFVAKLWTWYRLLLFDTSSLQDDYELTFDTQTLIDIFLYSIMETAAKPLIRAPAFFLTFFVSPYAFGTFLYIKLYGEATYDFIQEILTSFLSLTNSVWNAYFFLFTNTLEAISIIWTDGIVHTITTIIEAINDVWNANWSLWLTFGPETIVLILKAIGAFILYLIKLPFVIAWRITVELWFGLVRFVTGIVDGIKYGINWLWEGFLWSMLQIWNFFVAVL